MRTSLFIISDLHLGGEPGPNGSPGFRICTDEGERRLAQFLYWVAEQVSSGEGDVHLVVNGDTVDFLAEKDFAAFTADDDKAKAKFERIVGRTMPIWLGFQGVLAAGGRLTMLLGNHDIELSLPGARRILLDLLGRGRFDFLYDNQALTIGPVLIEHGNRYDAWNVVSHDHLRQIRSAVSRRESPPRLPPSAGSLMVEQIVNRLKADFPFVDLLKPENAGMVPILAVLDPSVMREIAGVARLASAARRIEFDVERRPVDPRNIAESAQAQRDQRLLRLAADLAVGGDAGATSMSSHTGNMWERLASATSEARRSLEIDLLIAAMRARITAHSFTFDVECEDEMYLAPARAATRRGFKVVSYGHTHLAKRIPIGPDAVYLNSGTWADLMRVPETLFSDDILATREQMKGFLDDLRANRLERYREQLPTFVRVEIADSTLISADVYSFDAPDRVRCVPSGQLGLGMYA